MIDLKEKEVVIVIPASEPAETLKRLQAGLIEMVKSLISVEGIESELVLDTNTKDGCICALELVQATLIDPEVQVLALQIANEVTEVKERIFQMSKELRSSFIYLNAREIEEAELWPVGEN